MAKIDLTNGAAPATPSAGKVSLYTKTDKKIYIKDDAGLETPLIDAGLASITALTGDVTATGPGAVAATLATVNANVGSFTNASITVNAKGLVTAASSLGYTPENVANKAIDFSTINNTLYPTVQAVDTYFTTALVPNYVPYVGAAADVDLGNTQRVTNCQDPSNPQDVATKNYVDSTLSTGYVPYSGASGDVDIGSFRLSAGALNAAQLENTFSQVIFDLDNFTLYDGTFVASANTTTRQLIDSLGTSPTVDWGAGQLVYNSQVRLDWQNGIMNDNGGIKVMDWTASYRQLFDFGGSYPSVDFGNYYLLNIGVTNMGPLLDWSVGAGGSVKIYYGSSATLVGDFTNQQLYNPSNALTLDWNQRILYDNTLSASVDWDYHYLVYMSTVVLDWQNFYLADSVGTPSVYWQSRFLKDNAGVDSADWQSRTLIDSNVVTAVDWQSKLLNDNAGTLSLDWTSRTLNNASGNATVSYNTYQLRNSGGSVVLNWSSYETYSSTGTTMFNWGTSTGSRFSPAVQIGRTALNLAPTATLHLDVGNATATNLRFTAGTTTGTTSTDGLEIGITAAGAGEIRQRENFTLDIYQNNAIRMQFLTNGAVDCSGGTQYRFGVGSASVPSITFAAGVTDGWWRSGTNQVSMGTNGVERWRVDSAGKNTIYQGTTLRGAMATHYSQINSVGNVGAGEDTLHTTTTPSGAFAANGDSFEVKCAGTFAANANNKRVKLKFGAITLFDTTALAFNTGDWQIEARIFRTTTTTGRSIVTWTCNNATLTTTCDYQAWAFNFLTTNTLSVTGEATSDNDVVQELMQVFWVPVS